MKHLTLILSLLVVPIFMYASNIEGLWKTYNTKTGEEQSLVRLYIENGKLYGEIIELLGPDKGKNLKCDDCPGSLDNKPIVGLKIVLGLVKDGKEWKGKNLLFDPETKKYYKCCLYMVDNNKLAVKGMVGPFSETRYWKRA